MIEIIINILYVVAIAILIIDILESRKLQEIKSKEIDLLYKNNELLCDILKEICETLVGGNK